MQRLAKHIGPVHYQYFNQNPIVDWICSKHGLPAELLHRVFARKQQITEVAECSDNTHPIEATK